MAFLQQCLRFALALQLVAMFKTPVRSDLKVLAVVPIMACEQRCCTSHLYCDDMNVNVLLQVPGDCSAEI